MAVHNKHFYPIGYAQIIKGPYGLVEDIRGIPGIDRVSGRIVQNVFVNKTDSQDTTTLRLVSFGTGKGALNRFRLVEGRVPTDGTQEILVSPAFLKANGLSLGSRIPLIIQGHEVKFKISGTAISPEYVYEIPNGQTLTPDPKVFGVAFVPYSTAASMLGMDGYINDISFTLDRGVAYSSVEKPVSRLLEHYGLTQIYPRKDQISYSMLNQELVGLKSSVNTTPVIFLAVAAAILYIMLRRMVEQQRGQIGVLKSFGFSDWQILRHYLGYAVLIGLLGGLGGGVAGTWLSFYFAKIYQQFFNIPGLSGKLSLFYVIVGTLLSLAFCLVAGYQGCKGVLALSPAEAMRPPSPKVGGRTMLERVELLWRALSTQGKMAVRNIFRTKQRSILAILGIAVAFSMTVATEASYDAIYYLINFQYQQVEKYDLKIGLKNYADKTESISTAGNIEGVIKAEPILEAPVTMKNRWLQKDVVVTGLTRGGSLYRLINDDGESVDLPANGLVVSTQLAKKLKIKEGDRVTVKPFIGDRKERQVQVTKVVPLYVGLGAYMEIDALGRMLSSSPFASSVLIQVDRDTAAEVRKELQEGKNISTIYDKTKMKAQFEELMASSQSQQFIILFFSFVMGFAIVYNLNIISLSEREREMATLMVIGMTEGEISRILLYEQGLLGLGAAVAGVPLSYGMLWAIVNASGSDIYNMPLVVEPRSLLIGFLGTLAFLLAAQWKMKGKVARLSMLDVLKQQD